MKVFCGLPQSSSRLPCALCIGNFDGVHLGHRELFSRLKKAAKHLGIPSAILTFSPHPRLFFALNRGVSDEAPMVIAPLRNKLQAFADAGIDEVTISRFTHDLANLGADAFIEKILVKILKVKWLIVGEHFFFGKNKTGTTDTLVKASKKHGFEVEILPSVMQNEKRISSSDVRHAIKNHDFSRAAELLGKPYCISGRVVHGNKRGHQLGFPTANLFIRYDNPVLSGAFITQTHGLAEKPLPSVSMIGKRPTIDDANRIVLETHLFDYEKTCYGKLVHVEFLKKLRDNQKFSGLDALKAAIEKDVMQAKAFFKNQYSTITS